LTPRTPFGLRIPFPLDKHLLTELIARNKNVSSFCQRREAGGDDTPGPEKEDRTDIAALTVGKI